MDVKKNIIEYLEREGFPFEMQVSQIFQKEGFSVNSSVYLEDVNSHKSREIDVICYKGKLVNKYVIFDIKFIVECKYSKLSPWIMFRADSDKSKAVKHDAMFRSATEIGKIALLEIENTASNKDNYLFEVPNNLFYGVRCITKNKNNHSEIDRSDVPYQAIMQVCNGVASSIKYLEEKFNNNFISRLEIYFPLIIVDGPLFECYLGETSEIIVNEIEQGIIKMEQPNLSNDKYYIRVISSKAMIKIIQNLSQSCNELLTDFDDKIPNTIAFINNKNKHS
ncbi:MAG: hypothetical protein P4L35_02010 [Ignavibacteriaceae bacterium]|nr:hypothetical protein [Ignavibacteriaceae bacterium]